MPEMLGVSDAARQLGARPADITRLFYYRDLRDDLCPIINGRRRIPAEYLPQILAMLRRRGKRIEPLVGTGEVHHVV